MNKKTKIILLAALALALIALLVFALTRKAGDQPRNGETTTASTTQPTETEPSLPTIHLEEREEGTYEQWLAAGMAQVTYMFCEDAEITGIWAASETEVEQKMQSQGVYIRFTSGGQEYWYCSRPLEAERREPNTMDMHTMVLGFSTYDPVETPPDVSAMTELPLESLDKYIQQSMLPTLNIN